MTAGAARLGLGAAEAIAWPFASPGELRSASVVPDPDRLVGTLSDRFRELQVDARPTDFTTIWGANYTLDGYLLRHARMLLEPSGDVVRLRPCVDAPGEEIVRWRWMSLALPVDLLVAAASLNGGVQRVELLDASLRILEPIAHQHVHATACVTFDRLWVDIALRAVLGGVRSEPRSFTPCEWRRWLRRAFVARAVLDAWMKHPGDTSPLEEPYVRRALSELQHGRLGDHSVLLEQGLCAFVRKRSRRARARGARRREMRGRFVRPPSELHFSRRSLHHLRSNPNDVRFRKLWIQMTRVRTLLYRHLVHDPATQGLDEFAKVFRRVDEYLSEELEEKTLQEVGATGPLRQVHVELRKAPGSRSKLERLHAMSNERHGSTPRISWILHFIRDDKAPHVEPLEKMREHYVTARRLCLIFQQRPDLLRSITGLDVASRELSGPLWCVVPALRMVLAESRAQAACLGALRPLGLTVHVGEDFRHLLSGLRAVAEPFEWRLIRRGDRLGHALALGWDPATWVAGHPRIRQPRAERMLDLAWVLEFVSTRVPVGIDGSTIESIRGELDRLVRRWDRSWTGDDLREAARRLGRLPVDWDRRDVGRLNDTPVDRLLRRLMRRRVWIEDFIQVNTEPQVSLLRVVRNELARLVARWRVTIEVNPSSNLLVGGLDHALALPMFRLDPFDRAESRSLAITISADDPLTFSTCLADEFAYAWAGMVVAGESPNYAHQWLERAARASRGSVFADLAT